MCVLLSVERMFCKIKNVFFPIEIVGFCICCQFFAPIPDTHLTIYLIFINIYTQFKDVVLNLCDLSFGYNNYIFRDDKFRTYMQWNSSIMMNLPYIIYFFAPIKLVCLFSWSRHTQQRFTYSKCNLKIKIQNFFYYFFPFRVLIGEKIL